MAEFDADLEALSDTGVDPAKERAAADKNKDKGKGVQVQPPPSDQTPPDDKNKDKGKDAGKDNDIDGPEPGKINEVREWGRRLQGRVKDLTPKLARAEARVKELETAAQNGTGAASPEQANEIKRLTERNKALEDHISYVDFTKSSEFQEKYARPYTEAWNRAARDFGQLSVRIPDGKDPETDEPRYKTRAGTADDLLQLANLPLAQLDAAAEEMFGRSAARVIRHVEKVRELAEAQDQALQDAQKRTGERTKQAEETHKLNTQRGKEMWTAEHKRLLEKYPKMFASDPEDADGNKLLESGQLQADIIFRRDDVPEDKRPKTAEELVRAHALAYQKIRNHNRIAHQLKKERAENAELRKALKEFEDSAPGAERAGKGARRDAGDAAYTVEAGMAELAGLDK